MKNYKLKTETEVSNSYCNPILNWHMLPNLYLYHPTIHTLQAHARSVTKFHDVMRGKSARARQ